MKGSCQEKYNKKSLVENFIVVLQFVLNEMLIWRSIVGNNNNKYLVKLNAI